MSRTDGDRVRLLEFCVPHGDKGGIWLGHDGEKVEADTAELTDRLYAAATSNYGVAGQAYVQYLVTHQGTLSDDIAKYRQAFLDGLGGTLGSVESRIANKVALLYAAGRLAMKAGLIDWKKDELMTSTRHAFRAIIEAGHLSIPPARRVQPITVPFGDQNRFPRVQGMLASFELPPNADGCFHRDTNRLLMRMASMNSLLDTAYGGPMPPAHHTALFKSLVAEGFLIAGDGNYSTKTVRFHQGKLRMLVFTLDARMKAAQAQIVN